MQSLKSRIYKVLAEQFYIDEGSITENIGPGDLRGWDSLGQIQLIIRLEKEFNFRLSVEEAISMNTVKDIVSVIERRMNSDDINLKDAGVSPASTDVGRIFSTSSLNLPKETFWGDFSLRVLKNGSEKTIAAVICGSSAYGNSLKKQILELLPARKIEFIQRPSGEPLESDIYEVAQKLSLQSPDLIIAAGGGSTIDTAKLAWALYEHPDLRLTDLEKPFSLPALRKKASFLAIPTTFGSGSEASSSALYCKDRSANKSSIISHEFIPDKVILDPTLGKSLSLKNIYYGAFDALTHGIEGAVSLISNPLVEPYALCAIKDILKGLDVIKGSKRINGHSLDLFCYASFFAGIVQNHCSVGLTHSIAHQLSKFGIAHGLGNALFLAIVIEQNCRKTKIYEKLNEELGFIAINDFTNIIDAHLNRSGIIPDSKTLMQIYSHKGEIIEGAMRDFTFRTNPVVMNKGDIEFIFDDFKRKFIA